MSIPVLATKLYIPSPRPKVVLRSRLIERLNQGLHRKLTLISAPAGSGKTTLVSAWVAGCDRAVAWLSLDEEDSDPARFLTSLVAALRRIVPNIGEEVLGVLQSSQPPPIEAALTVLLNEITGMPDDFVLVLDDYHVVDAKAGVPGVSQAVDDALTSLLEHLPPQMHLVITTREDPQLPLARLRARDQLTELRAKDLRFTNSEAAGFLNQTMGLDLSADDIDALETRTEGWIAGLQLAAISIQGHEDVPAFIRAFAGDHRYIVDYLVEEVLQRQSESVRSFLLQTSILERLNGPLCDAVTGQKGSKARLEALERGNFFLVPLDDKRHWYRYHHLFAEVLYAYLIAEMVDRPGQLSALHMRASEWYEHYGSPAQAIRHALAAEDFERAADLIEMAVPAMLRSRQEAALLGWFRALPDGLVRFRPVLSAGYASALLSSGELEGVEARLRDAERWLGTSDPTVDRHARPDAPVSAMIVVDEEEFRLLPGSIAISRAGQALVLGDVAGTVKYARRALDLIPEDDYLRRGGAAVLLGLAAWTRGDLEAAHRAYAEGMAWLQRAGNISDAIGCAIAVADIRIAQGCLHEAMRTYERGLQLATVQTAHGEPVLRGTSDMHVGMSAIHREWNDLDAATQHLLKSKELGEHIGLPQNRYRWRVAMSRIREAEGDLDGALDLLEQADRLYVSDFSPNVHPVPALQIRMWVAQGRLSEAMAWARERGLSTDDDLSYLREFEHITLARVLLALYKSDPADHSILAGVGPTGPTGLTGLLERLLQAAEEGGRTASVIEILGLQALVKQTRNDIPAALVSLERALALAEPEGYIRIFVDEGPAMAQLLVKAASRGLKPEYTGRLLAAFEKEQEASAGSSPLPISPLRTPATPTSLASHPSTEPLSQRELEVLRLFRTDLSGPEIARELVISLSTVRTHTKGIYSKLNVNSRRAAVKRAAELNMF
ncbi:MAG: LuxR C-terminal-related transcriptional regulator [Chloroflexota bacterium]